MSGVDITMVAAILGHKDIQTTIDTDERFNYKLGAHFKEDCQYGPLLLVNTLFTSP